MTSRSLCVELLTVKDSTVNFKKLNSYSQGRRVGWHTGAAFTYSKKKKKKESFYQFQFFCFFSLNLTINFLVFLSFTFNLQIFGEMSLQAQSVSAAFQTYTNSLYKKLLKNLLLELI